MVFDVPACIGQLGSHREAYSMHRSDRLEQAAAALPLDRRDCGKA